MTSGLYHWQYFTPDGQDPQVVANVLDTITPLLVIGEEIRYIAVQKKLGVTLTPASIIITTKRLLIHKPGLLGRAAFEDHGWRELADVRIQEGPFASDVTWFLTNRHQIVVESVPKAQARWIYQHMREREEQARAAAIAVRQAAARPLVPRGPGPGVLPPAPSLADQVVAQNQALEALITQLQTLLVTALHRNPTPDLARLKRPLTLPAFVLGTLAVAEPPPNPAQYQVPEPTGMQKLVPGARAKHAQAQAEAQARYSAAATAHQQREQARLMQLADAQAAYDAHVAELQAQTTAQHAEIDTFQQHLEAGQPGAVENYCAMVLDASVYPESFPHEYKLAYTPASRQLVVEFALPPFEAVPEVAVYKYVKTRNETTTMSRKPAERKALYASMVAQITLRTLYELFTADRYQQIDTLVFNGYVSTIDRGTGRPMQVYLTTVRTNRDVFLALELARVDPIACLKVLNAALSPSPAELAPVRPVLDFNMVDPRFIQETDVLSELDQRPNLMELTPSEFETLIANLFQKMGLETRLTQASRDGGVDCVAFDRRPVLGGKVVIQAKRYKHTVGVSAVRDLFGTVQNEGASKGILVTTSGFGKAAYDFIANKPLELFDGSNLLYLLEEHAGIRAKIEIPTEWRDPEPDAPPT